MKIANMIDKTFPNVKLILLNGMVYGKTAVEVKGKANITRKDFKGLTAIREEWLLENYVLVALEDIPRRDGDITILPWKDFITNLWQGAYV